jgi:hypothetical protein
MKEECIRYKKSLDVRFKMVTGNLREKYDHFSLYDTEESKGFLDDGKRVGRLMEEKGWINENTRIAKETINKGNKIMGSLHRSRVMMEVSLS